MTNMSPAGGPEYPPYQLDQVTARIAPYFDDGNAAATEAQCRVAAREMLLAFGPFTGKELQLTAQMLACGMAAINCLRCADRLPEDQVEPILRMREDALKLHTLSTKAQKTLEACQRDRQRGQAARPAAKAFDEAKFNTLMTKVRDMVTYARARSEAARVELDLAAASVSTPHRKAAEAWAEDLRDLTAWTQQTQH